MVGGLVLTLNVALGLPWLSRGIFPLPGPALTHRLLMVGFEGNYCGRFTKQRGQRMGLAKDEMVLRIKRLKNLQSWVMPDGQRKCDRVPLTQTGIWATCHQQEGKRMALICF